MTEIDGKSNYSKRAMGNTTAFDFEMINKPTDLADGPVVVKMKSQKVDCLPQTCRVEW